MRLHCKLSFHQPRRIVIRLFLICCLLIFIVKTFQGSNSTDAETRNSVLGCSGVSNFRVSLFNSCVQLIAEIHEAVFRFLGIYKEARFLWTDFNYPMQLSSEELDIIASGGKIHSVKSSYPYVYKPVITPRRICVGTKDALLPILIIVKSANDNKERRLAIRATWGNEKTFSFIRIVFLLGLKNSNQDLIRQESEDFDDIIQYNFIDNYYNNTLKLTSGFMWAKESCQNFPFVVFIDDDYMLIIGRLRRFLTSLITGGQRPSNVYLGQILPPSFLKPHRSPLHKWYIPISEYPYDVFPPFITAGSIVVSWDVVVKFARLIPHTKPLYIDDVYLGVIAQKLHIQAKNCSDITDRKIRYTDRKFKTIISTHGYGCPMEMRHVWRKLNRQRSW